MNIEWFSTNVRIVCLIETIGAVDFMDCVHIFQSLDWKTAFKRALEFGKSHEAEYLNMEQQRVRWRFKEIISLDILHEITDGLEVYSQPVDIGNEKIDFDAVFEPEKSEPTQSVFPDPLPD